MYHLNNKFKEFILCFSAILLFSFHFYLTKKITKPTVIISKQDAVLNLNDNIFRFFSGGQERLLSSLLWVHTLMESDIEHYTGEDLNSWMYLRFNTITQLDPHFYDAYLVGGKYLSVVKDDIVGAKEIFEKGLFVFPQDFWLSLLNGFNYFFELGDPYNAILNYEVAVESPLMATHAPYLPSMLARLKASEGAKEDAFRLLYQLYLLEPEDSRFREHQENTLYSIKAELDLECLNSSASNCSQVDFRGNSYILKDNGEYVAQDEWKRARITRRGFRGVPIGEEGTPE
jgi:tetratricopeptide (TPR) repeat protein